MVNRTVVAIILNKKGEFLLQKKTLDYEWFPGEWGFFGGGMEEGETPKEAIKRELLEESGIEFNEIEFFGKETSNLKGHNFEESMFITKFEKDLSNIRLGEGAGFAFFDKTELENLNLFSGARTILLRYLEEHN